MVVLFVLIGLWIVKLLIIYIYEGEELTETSNLPLTSYTYPHQS